MVEIAVDNEMLNDMEPLDSETAGAMKPAATQPVERRSSEFARRGPLVVYERPLHLLNGPYRVIILS